MHKLNIILFISALVFSSCEDEIAFKGSDIAQKLVVNCLIAADSTIMAQVEHSNSIQNKGNGDNAVTNAVVKLYENSQFIGLLTLSKDGFESNPYEYKDVYTLKDFKATVGNSYKLEVEVPDYELVTAQISIPKPVQIVSVDTSIITIRESWGGDSRAINLAITFKDPPSEKNFYRIVLRQKIGESAGGGYHPDYGSYYYIKVRQEISLLRSNDLSINPTGSSNEDLFEAASNNSMVFNDYLFDGKEYTISVFTTDCFFPNSSYKEFNEYVIELHSISKEYYSYAKSLSLFSLKDGDPFAEPVQVYSNIENGYGIFASYSIAQKIFLDGVYPDEGTEYFYE